MILLQNATVVTKCDVYYKLQQYNLHLQNFASSVKYGTIKVDDSLFQSSYSQRLG